MGYGIILWLDDRALRQQVQTAGLAATAARLAEDLTTVVGTDPYPSRGLTPLRAGHWLRAGAAHSARPVTVVVDAEGARLEPGPRARPAGPAWVPQFTLGAMAKAERELLRRPGHAYRAMAQGRDLSEAAFGPDIAGRSVASVWWLFADALAEPFRLGPATGISVAGAIETDRHVDVPAVGHHANALNKAGSLLWADEVGLVWSGNRISAPEALEPREKELLGL